MSKLIAWSALGVVALAALLFSRRAHADDTSTVDSSTVDTSMRKLPRGIRNHNPGNIEWIENPAKRWNGMVARDGRYGIFSSAKLGIRAIGGELRASESRGQTLQQAIAEWAPPPENDTEAYVAHVVKLTGIGAGQSITRAMRPAIAEGIIQHENGQQPYRRADIRAWVYLV